MESVDNASPPIAIFVAVAVRLYREGLASLLNVQKHLSVTGTAGTAVETLSAVRHLKVDVVIIDASLPDVFNLMSTFRAERPSTRILAFAVAEEMTTVLDYAKAGADGFVTANVSADQLVEAIKRTAAGELLCSPRLAAQLLRQAAHHAMHTAARAFANGLTQREVQVLALLKKGMSNKEIATALNISEATVKNHVHHLLAKMQVASRGQAVAATAPPLQCAFAQST